MKTLAYLQRVSKVYRKGPHSIYALREVELCIEEGDFISIMGPSGSGKSTLLNIIGLLDKPTTGKYLYKDTDISLLDDQRLSQLRATSIGFVFQSFNLLPQLNVLENIELPMIYACIPGAKRRKRSMELANIVGLSERIYHRPAELSGGEMQRVAIARALSNNPSLILADEPTGNLDKTTGEAIVDLLCQLNQQGVTIIIVTHNPAVSSRTKRQLKIHDGVLLS